MKISCIGMLLLTCSFAQPARAQQTKYVVLISIDGLRSEFFNDSTWQATTLRRMKNNGAYADSVQTVYPSVTYPAHATLVTGLLPIHHSIFYNEPFEGGWQSGTWYWNAKDITAPTLWTAARDMQISTAAIWWPVSAGGAIDHCLPEIWPIKKNDDKSVIVRSSTTPRGYFEALEKSATGPLTSDDFDSEYLEMDEKIGKMASYTIRTWRPQLLAVHFACADHFQHTEGRNGAHVHAAVKVIDKAIGGILQTLKTAGIADSTAVIVTGDHGFADVNTAVAPNVWLEKKGIRTTGINWVARFHISGAAAFLHIRDVEDEKMPGRIHDIVTNLPDSTRKYFRLIEQKEMLLAGAAPRAQFALDPTSGVTFIANSTGEDKLEATGGAHGYFTNNRDMQTGFVGYGNAFRKGAVNGMQLPDIACIVADILRLRLGNTDGHVPQGLLITTPK